MSISANIDPLLLRQLTQRLDHAAPEVAEPHGLTVDQWRMLGRLADAAGETMAGLATALALTGPTTTRVADRLVSLTLVYRDVDTTDRRRVVLRLSPRGRRLYDQLATEVTAAQDSAIRRLEGAAERELAWWLARVTDDTARPLSIPAT